MSIFIGLLLIARHRRCRASCRGSPRGGPDDGEIRLPHAAPSRPGGRVPAPPRRDLAGARGAAARGRGLRLFDPSRPRDRHALRRALAARRPRHGRAARAIRSCGAGGRIWPTSWRPTRTGRRSPCRSRPSSTWSERWPARTSSSSTSARPTPSWRWSTPRRCARSTSLDPPERAAPRPALSARRRRALWRFILDGAGGAARAATASTRWS